LAPHDEIVMAPRRTCHRVFIHRRYDAGWTGCGGDGPRRPSWTYRANRRTFRGESIMLRFISPAAVPTPGMLIRDGMRLIHQRRDLDRRLAELRAKAEELNERRDQLAAVAEPDPEAWERLNHEIIGLHHACDELGSQVDEQVWHRYEGGAATPVRRGMAA
jgi:hypothetical protein